MGVILTLPHRGNQAIVQMGERRAQFMRGVIGYIPVRGDQRGQTFDHGIAVLRQFVQLVASAIDRDCGCQITGTNFPESVV